MFFGTGGHKCIVFRKNQGNNRLNARFFLRFSRDLTVFSIGGYNECTAARSEEKLLNYGGKRR